MALKKRATSAKAPSKTSSALKAGKRDGAKAAAPALMKKAAPMMKKAAPMMKKAAPPAMMKKAAAPAAAAEPQLPVATVPAFSMEIRLPSWKKAKCAVCHLRIGDNQCFQFMDVERFDAEESAKVREKAEKAEEEERNELKKKLAAKRKLKAENPKLYERNYKRHNRHGMGCPCCEAMGLSLPGDELQCIEDEEPEEDSLDIEEEEINIGGRTYYMHLYDEQEDGKRRGKYIFNLHCTERCLGQWRKPHWWAKYRPKLKSADEMVASSGPSSSNAPATKLTGPELQEFKRVWKAIGEGREIAPPAGNSAASRGIFTAAQYETFKNKLEQLNAEKKDTLVRMLKKNGIQGITNDSKPRVAQLVAVCQTLGFVFLPCPKCNRGQIAFDYQTGQVTCKGYKQGMTGWRHCEGPAKVGKTWDQLATTPWQEGLAEPAGPRPPRRNFEPYGYGGYDFDAYDGYDPFDMF